MLELEHININNITTLTEYILGLVSEANGAELIDKYKILETTFTYTDVIISLDRVMAKNPELGKIKDASNKLFNILHRDLSLDIEFDYSSNNFINYLEQDNLGVLENLLRIKPLIKSINKEYDSSLIIKLKDRFESILRFTNHYIVAQNILFPELESQTKYTGCLKILWSFQDDVIRNCKRTLNSLEQEKFDLEEFNRVSSPLFFNINTLVFRERFVLFPAMMELFNSDSFNRMEEQLLEFPLEYSDTSRIKGSRVNSNLLDGVLKLSTGELNIEQLELIFKMLPLDVTFIDENDEVRFYSDPVHRVFPRTSSIIGRKVQNCHPPESVSVVNKIIDTFKSGKKNEAVFWIKMGKKYVLIKYFSIRNNQGEYCGILEVTQEISDINKLTGERRLLDWDIE